MKIELENVLPAEIEKRSFEIITEELGDRVFDPLQEPIIKRAIHTSADFEYADSLCFSEHAVEKALDALRKGAYIVTDTQMGKSGINKKVMAEFGGEVCCFMSDPDVAETAKKNGTTRAVASMEKAAKLDRPLVFAIGNAPTALIQLYEMIQDGPYPTGTDHWCACGLCQCGTGQRTDYDGGCTVYCCKGQKGRKQYCRRHLQCAFIYAGQFQGTALKE